MLADRRVPARGGRAHRLLALHAPGGDAIGRAGEAGKIHWRIEHDYRELNHGLGLDHFEGRSWLGWHHHATLVTAAHLFATALRVEQDPKAPAAAV